MQLLPYAILDMDGTLLDSSGMWDEVARGLLAQWDAVYTPRQGDETMTMTIDGAAAYFVEQCRLPVTPEELARQIRDRARRAYGTIATLKPGVREALDLMKDRGITMCVASGTEKPLVDAALEQFGILDRFDEETSVDRNTAFRAVVEFIVREGGDRTDLEKIAALLTFLLEKVLDEEKGQ